MFTAGWTALSRCTGLVELESTASLPQTEYRRSSSTETSPGKTCLQIKTKLTYEAELGT